MSLLIGGLIAGLLSAGGAVASAASAKKQQQKAMKQAEEDQLKAEMQALNSEKFAESEGQGLGDFGKISLDIDDEIDENKSARSTVRI